MATWHQLQAPTRLYHDTQWTVVEDPHNNVRSLTTFTREADARAYRDRVSALRPNVPAYVLKPARLCERCGGIKPAGQSCGCFDNHSQ